MRFATSTNGGLVPAATKTADFTRVAHLYDDTRNLPLDVLGECYRRLGVAGILSAGRTILDAGCGTGQLSLPLILAAHPVIGVDVSEAMLERARAKVPAEASAVFQVGDVRQLDFADATFDLVLVSKLFQHVSEWQRGARELLRVTRSGGHLVHVRDRGLFLNPVRAAFAAECDRLGYRSRFAGLQKLDELHAFLVDQGAWPVAIEWPHLGWEKRITYGEALEQLDGRAFAEFWDIPDEVHNAILANVRGWVASQPNGAATVGMMRPWLAVEVYQVP